MFFDVEWGRRWVPVVIADIYLFSVVVIISKALLFKEVPDAYGARHFKHGFVDVFFNVSRG